MNALALEYSVLRVLMDPGSDRDGFEQSAVASSLKVRGARLQQHISQLQMEMVGVRGLRAFKDEDVFAHDERTSPMWPSEVSGKSSTALLLCGASIYGGSEEIQKNIIAKRAFGL